MTQETHSFDLIIVGAGLVGASFANLVAQLIPTWRVALVDSVPFPPKRSKNYDARSIVLNQGSQHLFAALDLWKPLQVYAAPIRTMQTTEQGHFGSVRLRASHYRVPALGYVIESYRLLDQLHQRLKKQSSIEWFCPALWQSLIFKDNQNYLTIDCENQRKILIAPLMVAVDGAHSKIRAHYDIQADTVDFKQHALVANLELTGMKTETAQERLTKLGPLTLLPLCEQRHALIWILEHHRAKVIQAYSENDFKTLLQQQLSAVSGVVTNLGVRSHYPLQQIVASRQGFPGGVLLGNAAHLLHPIGAQGFNLGLRDALTLCQSLKEATQSSTAPVWQTVLQKYVDSRHSDQQGTVRATHWLSHLLTADGFETRCLRRLLLMSMQLPPLKRRAAKKAMGLGLKMPLPCPPRKPEGEAGTAELCFDRTPKALQPYYDIVIVGGGIVGATLALSLASTQLRIALLDRKPPTPLDATRYDSHVSAINLSSQHLLNKLGVWSCVASHTAPYQCMQVWDAQSRAQLRFDAREVDQPVLGWIVENNRLVHALWRKIDQKKNIDRVSPVACDVLQWTDQHAALTTSQGSLTTRLLIGADGALSWVRTQAAIPVVERSYEQKALTVTVTLTQPHQATAWQCFTQQGPIALLPLDDPYKATVIWSRDNSAEWDRCLQGPAEDLAAAIAASFDGRFGRITVSSQPMVFPLVSRHAKHYVKEGLALCGDAAHTIHPLAGQGVNLGLLDAVSLCEIIKQAQAQSSSWGDLSILRRYERCRRGDNHTMIMSMKLLKQGFAQSNRLAVGMRAGGVRWLDHSTCLKALLMQHAMGQRWQQSMS